MNAKSSSYQIVDYIEILTPRYVRDVRISIGIASSQLVLGPSYDSSDYAYEWALPSTTVEVEDT